MSDGSTSLQAVRRSVWNGVSGAFFLKRNLAVTSVR
jgi:hypothetical protein